MKKKHVLVLGGSSDIGIEVIKIFLKLNWNVSAHYFRNKTKLNLLKKKSKNLNLIKLDFSKANPKVEILIKKNFKDKYDSIINLIRYIDNIGYENTNLKSITQSLTANMIIPVLIEKNCVKKMISQKWGRILNCSSIGIKFGGGKNSFNYSLSKHCLEFIPNSYKFWAENNVFINNLRIGVTDTKIHKRMKKNLQLKERLKLIPAKRMATPSEMAIYIVNLSTEKNSYMTGQTLTVSGGE